MMQYYRIGETLEPLESLPPEEKSILAVLCPEELPGALLPHGIQGVVQLIHNRVRRIH